MINMTQQEELLRQLLERVNETHDACLNAGADVKAVADTVKDLSRTVWGNGKPGLQEGQIRMEASLNAIQKQNEAQVKFCAAVQGKKASKAEETLWYVIRVACASLVVSGLAWIFWMLIIHQAVINTVSAGVKP
jgi:hypothetical protein